MTGTSKNTVTRLLVELGDVCARYQYEHLMDLPCKRLQVDEIWSFCYSKQKNIPTEHTGEFGYGDVWTFTAICADTKLVPLWMVGPRDGITAVRFISDLAHRMAGPHQLTTDGHQMYKAAVEEAYGGVGVDYAMLEKVYGSDPQAEVRYSPATCIGTRTHVMVGEPDPKHISTSYVERQNLTMRMSMRRFTRLTNAFSKKVRNLEAAVALHFMHYNFCRFHRSLGNRTTPAMAAGVAKKPWSIEDIVNLLIETEKPK
jgi:IS1 family transposase